MLFFRSEEMVERWCAARNVPVNPLVTVDQLWGMARAFYDRRLESNLRRPSLEETRTRLAGLGLTGAFWDPQPPGQQKPVHLEKPGFYGT